jgi:hypothetical protein
MKIFSTPPTNKKPHYKSLSGICAIAYQQTNSIVVAFKVIIEVELHLYSPACNNNKNKN